MTYFNEASASNWMHIYILLFLDSIQFKIAAKANLPYLTKTMDIY